MVVVRGEGRAFCAGLDLDMLAAESMPEGFYALQEEALVGLERLDRLVVAQIHGYCLGGGLQLALASDIRILAEDAVLGLPAAAEGLPPGMATWRLPRYVELGRAMRLSVGGERVDAQEALAIGLADHVLPVAGFADAAAELVAHYLAVPRGPRGRRRSWCARRSTRTSPPPRPLARLGGRMPGGPGRRGRAGGLGRAEHPGRTALSSNAVGRESARA